MSSYIVLKRKSLGAPGNRSVQGVPGDMSAFQGEKASGSHGGGSWELTFESADEKQAAEISADPVVKIIARTMPTALIHPVICAGDGVTTVADANTAWGIPYLGVEKSQFTGDGVTIAVLDTGIDRAHPAFSGVELVEEDFSNSGNGDKNGHGTHCAGTIFGRDVSGKRIGIARGVKQAFIGKVLNNQGMGESEMTFRAMQWALEKKADIISMSLGFNFTGLVGKLNDEGWPLDLATSTALESYRNNLRMFDAIMNLLRANQGFGHSPLVIAAAGNDSRRNDNETFRIAASLPAAAEGIISVAAIGNTGTVADFSNCFPILAAPGVNIMSAWPENQFNTISGTSMACPHVAGVAALWWESLKLQGTKPNAKNVTAKLLATSRKDLFRPKFDQIDFGEGLVTAP